MAKSLILHQDFRDVTALLWSDKLRPVIDRVMPLSEGKEAYAIMERGKQFGKIVLTPSSREQVKCPVIFDGYSDRPCGPFDDQESLDANSFTS